MRKIVQIAPDPEGGSPWYLCDDGTVWFRLNNGSLVQVELTFPEDEERS